MSQDEVVAEVHWVLRPGDEMIDISCAREIPVAVETATVLKFDEHRADTGQITTRTAEQELFQW